jgi:hypothetical protein
LSGKYTDEFYKTRDSRTRHAADRIISIVQQYIDIDSVVDLGCGVGTWLDVFKSHGASEVLGIEGPWVDMEHLVIDQDEFLGTNLDQPLLLDRKFDLAISMEVAEHISIESADTFIKNIVGLSPVVLFSAAVPLQGGRHHVNEQWPSYWKVKFEKHGYRIIDAIRDEVWDDDRMDVWYVQNCFIYVSENQLSNYPKLKQLIGKNENLIDAVHPRMYENKMRNYSLSKWVRNKMGRLK